MFCQHPGKILLKQYLELGKISQNALARAIKVPPRRINEIIHEKRGITADTAVRLAAYFGNSASYWMHLQSEFEIGKVKHNIGQQLRSLQTPTSTRAADPAPEKTARPRVSNNIKRRLMR